MKFIWIKLYIPHECSKYHHSVRSFQEFGLKLKVSILRFTIVRRFTFWFCSFTPLRVV